MEDSKIVLGIVGSPNPEGRTHQLVMAALKGAAEAGATIELVQLSEYVVEACKDLVWYDNLPYLRLSLAGERRLLADLVAMEAADKMGTDVLSGLGRSDAFKAAGRGVDSLLEVTQVYEAGVKAFERK
jgi:hypothetical protein